MVSSSLNLRFYASIIFLFGIHANAQVTGEGGAPFGTNTETVPAPSITVSVAPSGSRPTNYYSSVHPQITLPSSSEPSSGLGSSSSSDSGNTTGMIVGIVIGLVFAVIISAIVLFFIRRRMMRSSAQRNNRAWTLRTTTQWSPDQKHAIESPYQNGKETPPYTFDTHFDGRGPTPPPRASTFDRV